MSGNLAHRRSMVLPSTYRTFYDEPVSVASAEGVWITDADGNRLLDAYNNVPVLGHSHPLVRERVAAALARVNTHTRYLSPEIVDYSQRLLAHFPAALDRVVHTCSGSEANDLALQLARARTSAEGVLVTAHAYHGTTTATKAISPSLSPVTDPNVVTVELPVNDSGQVDAAALAERVREGITTLERRGVGVAAAVVDSCLTSDGILGDEPGFLRVIADAVRERGGLYVADEVQAGFGRTGRWWGFERHDLTPDLVTLGKPMANGIPAAAVIGREEIFADYGAETRYFNTAAGTPVAAAAGDAVLEVIEGDGLVERAHRLGAHLVGALGQVFERRAVPHVIRSAGLMVGVDLSTAGVDAGAVVQAARREGLLISTTGRDGSTLKVRPPLAISDAELEVLLERLDRALASVAPQAAAPR